MPTTTRYSYCWDLPKVFKVYEVSLYVLQIVLRTSITCIMNEEIPTVTKITGDKLKTNIRPEEDNKPRETTDTACGIQFLPNSKRFKLGILQCFATSRWALVFLSMSCFFTECVVNGIFAVMISAIEKQFQLRTTESAIIGGMMDLGACLALLGAAYFGDRICKTQWVGRAIFISGIGCFVFVLPQFVSPPYTLGEEILNFCGNVTKPDCEHLSPLRKYRYVFIFGMLLCGIGSEYPSTLGLAFIDENVKQSLSSLYNGIFYGVGGMGPVVGYVLGGATLRIFTDPGRPISIDPTSTVWVGAWWIGYLIVGTGLLLGSVPVMLLPRVLPNTEQVRKDREQGTSKVEDENRGKVLYRILGLLKNKIFVLMSMAMLIHQTLIYGFLTYAVKLGAEIYGMTESTAAFTMGALGIGSSVLGYFAGGAIVTKFNLKLKGIVRFVFFCGLLSFLTIFGFLFKCPEGNFAGVRVDDYPYNMTYSLSSVDAECNTRCGCTTDLYNPVCDDIGIMYYSPCHAGCMNREERTVFTECSCVVGLNTTTVSANNCQGSICQNFYPVLAIVFVSFLSGFLCVTPSIQATIRSVPFDERAMALSAQHIVLIVGGRLLGRLLFGQCLGSACLISSTECGEQGTCRLYHKGRVVRNVTILMASGKCLGVVLVATAWIIIKRRDRRQEHLPQSAEGAQSTI